MKIRVVEFLSNLIDRFTMKATRMGKLKPHIDHKTNIIADTQILQQLKLKITPLSDKLPNFYALLLYWLIDIFVPVMRRWQARLKAIQDAGAISFGSHPAAIAGFKAQLEQMCTLLLAVNSTPATPMVTFTPKEKQSEGAALIAAFEANRADFMRIHEVVPHDCAANDAHKGMRKAGTH